LGVDRQQINAAWPWLCASRRLDAQWADADEAELRQCIASALAGGDEEVKRLWNDWIQEQAQPARQAVGLGLKIKESICSALPSKPL